MRLPSILRAPDRGAAGSPGQKTPLDRRVDLAGEILRDHHAEIEPPPEFAARVVLQIPTAKNTVEMLGWAAVRVLPAGIVLALALAWLGAPSYHDPTPIVMHAATGGLIDWHMEEGS